MRDLEAQLRIYGVVLDRAEPATVDVTDAPTRPARRAFVVAVAAAVVIAVCAAAIAIATTGSGNARRPNVVTPSSSAHSPVTSAPGVVRVLAIGDSVMLGAKAALAQEMPGIAVDAVLSRQFSQASAIVDLYRSGHVLPNTVVVALGTNGAVSATELDSIMQAVAGRQVYFVTVRVPRAWESEVNGQIRALPARWPNAHVIDWHDYAGAHDDWFFPDGFHVTPVGQQAYSVLLASSLGLLPEATPNAPSGLDVVALVEGDLPPAPLAVAGGSVWVAMTDYSGTAPFVRLERHDPTTTKLVATVEVHQESVDAIVGDGDTLWVAGGGDGGVPETTVSRVDARTGSVVFTKTLTGTPCACPIATGSAGVWLVGNGSDVALRLSPTDGHVIATVALASKARASMETSSRLLVGLDDGSVASIDPQANRVERLLATGGNASTAPVTAMVAVPAPIHGFKPAIEGYIAHADNKTFALFAASGQMNQFLTVPFVPTAIASVDGRAFVFGGDRLELQPVSGENPQELAYDISHPGFTKVTDSPATQVLGFRNALVVGNRVWVVYDDQVDRHPSAVVVIDAPAVHEG